MRKHFLLLMLMALLPLAGFAQTVSFGEVGIGKYTYGGVTLPEPVVKDSKGAILTKGTHYTVTDGIFSDAACTSLVDAGDYKNLKCDGTRYYREIIGIGAYDGQEARPYFTVDKAEVAVNLAAPLTKKYGEDDPVITAAMIAWPTSGAEYEAAGFKYGDTEAVFDLSSVSYTHSGVNANATPYEVEVSGATAAHYTLKIAGGIKINPRDFSATNITVAVSNNEVTYDGTDTQKATVTVTDKVFGALELDKDFTVAYAGGHTTVGDYDITVTGKGNYSADNIVGDKPLKIGKATILATPKATKVYDGKAAVPEVITADKFVFAGFVGDGKSATDVTIGTTKWASDATLKKDVKVGYPLTVTDNKMTVDGNYQIVTQPGTLDITPKSVEIYANDQTVEYGSSIATDAMTVEDLSGSITNWTVAGKPKEGDLAAIKRAVIVYEEGGKLKVKANDAASAADKTVLANYTPAYNKKAGADQTGTLAYTKGTITIALDPAKVTLTKAYDGTAAAIVEDVTNKDNLTIIGSLVGDDKLVLTGLKATVEENTGNVGNYKVTLSGATVSANADKYTINYVTTYYEVTKKALTVTVNPQSTKVDAAEAEAIDYTLFKVEGLVGTDKQENIFKLTLAGDVLAAGKIIDHAAGDYIILGEKVVDAAANYSGWNTAKGKLTIVPATATILNDAEDLSELDAAGGATVAFTSRDLKKGVWTSMVLPFATTVRQVSSALGYAIVDMLDTDPESSDMNFKIHIGAIPAYTPFLVKTDDNINMNTVTFAGVNIVKLEGDVAKNLTQSNKDYNFIGKMDLTAIESDFWAVGSKMTADEFMFNKYAAGKKVAPMRAYITAKPGVSAAPTIYIEEADGTVTAINAISADGVAIEKANAEGWYTLQGVKLDSAPTQKGIYIYNGKKIAIK